MRTFLEFVIIFHVFSHRYDDSNGVAIFPTKLLENNLDEFVSAMTLFERNFVWLTLFGIVSCHHKLNLLRKCGKERRKITEIQHGITFYRTSEIML